MKKSLQKFFAAAGTVLLAGFALPSQASHVQGSEMTYTCIAPNMYIVDLKLYRDCTGIAAPSSANLNIKSPGCNTGRNLAMTKIGVNRIGNLYCPQLGAPTCTSTGNPNYEEVVFSATVTFTAIEAQCQDWTMSWTECCRPNIANIANAQSNSFYTEAFVKLGSAASGTIINNSPQFNSIVVPYVNRNQPILLSSNAIDLDGDSLVYSLVTPMDNQNTLVNYSTHSGQTVVVVNPQDSAQFMYLNTAGFAYSPTTPLPSYHVDWSGPTPQATPYFHFDPQNGSLGFTPAIYSPSPSVQGLNKYALVVKVDEYRTINGAPVKIGAVRREMFITVVDCGPNQNPIVAAPVANGQPISQGDIINLRPGTPLNFTFAAEDNNTSDVVTMDSDVADILPGAVFTKTTGNRPGGTVTWTPSSADVRGQVYYFRVMVQDNACPVKGQQVRTFGVRVSNIGGVTGIPAGLTQNAAFTAYPNPFGNMVTFKINVSQPNQQLLIYNVLGQQVDQISLKGRVNTEQEVTWTNAAKFPAGQYIVRLNGASGQSLKINKLQ